MLNIPLRWYRSTVSWSSQSIRALKSLLTYGSIPSSQLNDTINSYSQDLQWSQDSYSQDLSFWRWTVCRLYRLIQSWKGLFRVDWRVYCVDQLSIDGASNSNGWFLLSAVCTDFWATYFKKRHILLIYCAFSAGQQPVHKSEHILLFWWEKKNISLYLPKLVFHIFDTLPSDTYLGQYPPWILINYNYFVRFWQLK